VASYLEIGAIDHESRRRIVAVLSDDLAGPIR